MKSKKSNILSFVLAFCIFTTMIPYSFAMTDYKREEIEDIPQTGFFLEIDPALEKAYREYSIVAEQQGKFVTLSIEDFVGNFNGEYDTVESYLASCIDQLNFCEDLTDVRQREEIQRQATLTDTPYNVTRASTEKWWHNSSTPSQSFSNGKYNLVGKAIKGDIIYEAAGGFNITGHTVLVAGTYYSSEYSQYYVRAIEAVLSGVCYGILCDERFESQKSYLDRPKSGNASDMSKAVDFAISQLGKKYYINTSAANLTSSRPDWYCSLLVYAAYKNQNITLCDCATVCTLMPVSIHNGNVTTLTAYNNY